MRAARMRDSSTASIYGVKVPVGTLMARGARLKSST